jgi:hypothetical protein
MKTSEEIVQRVEDIVWASDRTFFAQHPRRRFRVRPAFDIEIEDFVRHASYNPPPAPADWCHWIIMQQVAPGVRFRWPFMARHDLPIDVSEQTVRSIWKQICPPAWKKKAREIERELASITNRA